MNLMQMSQEVFIEQFNFEITKIGANSALIKNNMLQEGKNNTEIANVISAYYRALGIKLNTEDQNKLEKKLQLEEDSLKINEKPTRNDYVIVNDVTNKYELFSLELIIAILKTPDHQLQRFRKTLN